MAKTTNKELDKPARDDPDWDTPLNDNFDLIDKAFGEEASISAVTPGGTLTLGQYQNAFLNFNGTITAPTKYRIPAGIGGFWVVRNATTSSGGPHKFSIDVVAGAGDEVEIPQGQIRTLYADGGGSLRSTNIYGKATQILFNRDDKAPDGDPTFTFDGNSLRFPNAKIEDGSAANPVIRSDDAADPTGIYFYGTNDAKGLALVTDGLNRLSLNFAGAFGVGDAREFGTDGQFLRSKGSGAHPVWGDANIRVLGDETTSSGSTVTFGGLTLSDYKLIIFIFKSITHNNTSGTRTLQIGGGSTDTIVTAQMNDNQQISGMAIIHPGSSVGFATTGNNSGTLPFSNGFVCNIDSGSTSVRAGWGGANFDGGRIWLLGVY